MSAGPEFQEKLRKLKNLVAVSKGASPLRRLARIVGFDSEDAFIAFLGETGLRGFTVDWDAGTLDFGGGDLTAEIDSLMAEFDSWGEAGGGKVGSEPASGAAVTPTTPPPEPGEVDYHGTPLLRPEHGVMMGLERLAGDPVPAVGKVEWNTFGFVAEGGRVVELGLYKGGLKALPETFQFPPNLRTLGLAENGLPSLPVTIGNLTSLEKLYLEGNQLKSLPVTIGDLSSLEELSLHDNELSSLPVTIGDLSSLKVLILEGNQLKSLPEESKTNKSIAKLRARGCSVIL
ncbi:MAG: leucine-rich repeat domain-containing protein [Promethearchaeota archaeon]